MSWIRVGKEEIMKENSDKQHYYIAIDLKSFYASVECKERNLNPLCTNLVVADKDRTDKTICLAVSPSLKSYGIAGRARLFEVVQMMKRINGERKNRIHGADFKEASYDFDELEKNRYLKADYIVAKPRMALYMQYSTRIYEIYLKHVSKEDIHVYSIDEVFIDVTPYTAANGITPVGFARMLVNEVYQDTGITATAGVGTNLYLCKVAMDIEAKHMAADEHGARIAVLDEITYREHLWNHLPITDFWRVGKGYEKKLASCGLYTMGDIARCSLGRWNEFHNEELLYRLFGKNAELLIDHAWGYEPVTIADIKAYKPALNSISSGQMLKCPYNTADAELIVHEMAEALSLELVEKKLVTDQIVLDIGYDKTGVGKNSYRGTLETDRYGRKVPGHDHGSINLKQFSSSTSEIVDAARKLYSQIVKHELLVRRIVITASHICTLEDIGDDYEQLSLFTDPKEEEMKREKERERKLQQAQVQLKKRFGKNAVLKGYNLLEKATTKERNEQIGGHRA